MNPALEIGARIRAREITAVEVARQALARAEALNPKVNAFTALLPERALAEAAAVDARIARGEALGPLAGVPYAVKNLFDLEGVTTLAGSKVLRGNPPAARDGILMWATGMGFATNSRVGMSSPSMFFPQWLQLCT